MEFLLEFLLNIVVILIIGLPLLLLEVLRNHSEWIENNYGILSIIVWLVTLIAVYIFVLPMFNLKPNPAFFSILINPKKAKGIEVKVLNCELY